MFLLYQTSECSLWLQSLLYTCLMGQGRYLAGGWGTDVAQCMSCCRCRERAIIAFFNQQLAREQTTRGQTGRLQCSSWLYSRSELSSPKASKEEGIFFETNVPTHRMPAFLLHGSCLGPHSPPTFIRLWRGQMTPPASTQHMIAQAVILSLKLAGPLMS